MTEKHADSLRLLWGFLVTLVGLVILTVENVDIGIGVTLVIIGTRWNTSSIIKLLGNKVAANKAVFDAFVRKNDADL